MARIDVSDVLDDEEIAGDQFSVIRRTETVNNYGEVVAGTQRFIAYGSVQPTGDLSLTRADAFASQQQSIKVFTRFRLRQQGGSVNNVGYLPDIILWADGSYLVRTVNDYTNFGSGYIEAECISTKWKEPISR